MFIDEMRALKAQQAVEGPAGLEEGDGRDGHRQWLEYNQETLLQ